MTAGQTVIESLGVYLPESSLSTADLLAGCAYRIQFPLESYTGIRSRRVAGKGQHSIQLAIEATERCLRTSRCDLDTIDVLISASCSRMDGADREFAFEPCQAIRLREHFGLRSALAFDVTNACAGVWTAIQIVDCMIQAGLVRRGLIVSGEYITHIARTAQLEIASALDPRIPCLTVGDAGAALILERGKAEATGLSLLDLRTLGEYCDYCVARPTTEVHGGAIMHTDMVRLGAAGVREGTRQAAQVLAKYGLNFDEVQHVILHQTSRMSLLDAVRAFNSIYGRGACPEHKVINNLAERGNTASTTQIVALWEGMLSGRIRAGDTTLFGISGSGITVGTAVYTLDELPNRVREAGPQDALAPDASPRAPSPNAPVVRNFGRAVRIASMGFAPIDGTRRSTDDLCRLAVDDALGRSSYSRSDIELIVHVGVSRQGFVIEPPMAAVIARMLRPTEDTTLPSESSTFGFDLINGSTGFLTACEVVAGMMASGRIATAMVVASEYDNNVDAGLPPSLVLETASAVILDGRGIGRSGFGSIATAYLPGTLDDLCATALQEGGRTFLRVHKSTRLESQLLEVLATAIDQALTSEGLSMNEILAVLSPQVSPAFSERLKRRMAIRDAQYVDHDYGRSPATSTVPLGLKALIEREGDRPHGPVMALSVASGIQAICAVYYF